MNNPSSHHECKNTHHSDSGSSAHTAGRCDEYQSTSVKYYLNILVVYAYSIYLYGIKFML